MCLALFSLEYSEQARDSDPIFIFNNIMLHYIGKYRM